MTFQEAFNALSPEEQEAIVRERYMAVYLFSFSQVGNNKCCTNGLVQFQIFVFAFVCVLDTYLLVLDSYLRVWIRIFVFVIILSLICIFGLILFDCNTKKRTKKGA